jgi:deoxyribodipyrimidine photo-lyase
MISDAVPVSGPSLHWFRSDLRLADNPALHAAALRPGCASVFVDETNAGLRPRGGASRWWLHHALAALAGEIAARGGRLILLRGDSRQLIPRLAKQLGCTGVTWNRRYGLAERETDAAIKATLRADGIAAESFNGALLYEPMEVRSQSGTPFRVFTPFWKAARALRSPATPLPPPADGALSSPTTIPPDALDLADLALLPTHPDWSAGLGAAWQPDEAAAARQLAAFIENALPGYAEARDRPDRRSTSRLSPYLASGLLSPRQIWHAIVHAQASGSTRATSHDLEKFLAELGWREFSYHLLFHFPDLATAGFQSKFDAFPWRSDAGSLRAWQRGLTGYPIVDAGMRELWQTGFMHNRVRMIVASFLAKHLLTDWRQGEAWFWDTLCDADPASNAASWQWVAGTGADAAPYFRIFNPMTQGAKFDPEGAYVRAFVPELSGLPDADLHQPWKAPAAVLDRAGVRLGETYPRPIVSHEAARERALAAFRALSDTGT